MRRWILATLVLFGLVVAGDSAVFAAGSGSLRVFNWSDYIDESILDDFRKETGIDVTYDVYDSNDILETKLLAGHSGYDLVFPTGYFLARQIQAGIFQPLDKSKLPNWKNLDPAIMDRVAKYDPGNRYAAVYMWGTTGIAYNKAMIDARMANAPVDSWSLVFKPENISKFADCGVYMLDSAEDIIPSVLNYLGQDPDSKDPAVLAKAEPALKAIRPYVRKFHSSEVINALANGDICLAVMWSGDAKIAADRADEAGKGIDIQYVIPKEGAQVWFDMMAIPKDAPNPDNALRFINYLLEPEVIAKATNYVTYPNANLASKPYIDKAILDDPSIYPPADVMAKLFVITPYDQRVQRVVTKIWQSVKTGR